MLFVYSLVIENNAYGAKQVACRESMANALRIDAERQRALALAHCLNSQIFLQPPERMAAWESMRVWAVAQKMAALAGNFAVIG